MLPWPFHPGVPRSAPRCSAHSSGGGSGGDPTEAPKALILKCDSDPVWPDDEHDNPQAIRLQTYRDVVRKFRPHPKAKDAEVEGAACGLRTVGQLRRRVLREMYVTHVGKEANKLEEVEGGIERNPEVLYTEYRNPTKHGWMTVILPLLKTSNLGDIEAKSGMSKRTLYSLVSGASQHERPRWSGL